MGNRVSQNEHFVERTGRGNGLRSFYEVPLYMYCALRLMYFILSTICTHSEVHRPV